MADRGPGAHCPRDSRGTPQAIEYKRLAEQAPQGQIEMLAVARKRARSRLSRLARAGTAASVNLAIIAAFRAGASVASFARNSGRPRRAIERVLAKAGLKFKEPRGRPRRSDSGDGRPGKTRLAMVRQDTAFVAAMRCAIAAGTEHCRFGILRDARPLGRIMRFDPMEHGSGCGSPAAAMACDDVAEAEEGM